MDRPERSTLDPRVTLQMVQNPEPQIGPAMTGDRQKIG